MLKTIYNNKPADLKISRLKTELYTGYHQTTVNEFQHKDYLLIEWGQRTMMVEFTSLWQSDLAVLPIYRYLTIGEWDHMTNAIQAYLNKEKSKR